MRGALFIGLVCASVIACGGTSTHDAGASTHGGHDAGDRDAAHADSGVMRDAAPVDAGPLFDAGSAPDRNHVKAGMVCARLAEIQCAGEAACCAAPGRDFATCRSEQTQACKTLLLLDDVSAADAVGFDPDAASQAFGELERRAAVCDPSIAAWAVSTDGFLGSIGGTLVKGESCKPDGGLNASASAVTIALVSCQLGAGVACLPTAMDWTCAPRVGPKGACFVDLNCEEGLYCDNPMGSLDGSCAERKAPGAACASATECRAFICQKGKCAAEQDVQAAYCLKSQ
jgi:hypothetical protein